MSMNISNASNTFYDDNFLKQVQEDFKKIESMPSARAETLEDIRDTVGKSYKTKDLEKLMEKYDPDAFAEYSKFAMTPDGAHSKRGLDYLSKWMDKVKKQLNAEDVVELKQNSISAKNEEKLSEKAQFFLKNLRKMYKGYDIMIGNSTDDLKALSKSGSKEFSVIFSNDEIERMASDEKYANEKLQGVEGAVRMCKRISKENGFVSTFGNDIDGTVNKIGVVVDEKGITKMFAELENSSKLQREKQEEEKEKKTTIYADSMEELLEKIHTLDWNEISEDKSGSNFNFAV